VAFEPVEENFAILAFNIRLNPSLHVSPVCAAASERDGPLDFSLDANLTTQGRLSNVEPSYTLPQAKTITVRGICLDRYILENWPEPQFLKIDVEGAAGAVLRGARSMLAQHRPTIYVELHGPEEQEAIRELMSTFCYAATTPFGLEVPDPTAGWFSPLICKPR